MSKKRAQNRQRRVAKAAKIKRVEDKQQRLAAKLAAQGPPPQPEEKRP